MSRFMAANMYDDVPNGFEPVEAWARAHNVSGPNGASMTDPHLCTATEAALAARSEFARLRMLVGHAPLHEIRDEVERLVDVHADTLARLLDESLPEQCDGLRASLDKEESRVAELEGNERSLDDIIEGLRSDLASSEDETKAALGKALQEVEDLKKQLAGAEARAERAAEGFSASQKAAATDREARREAERRVGVWAEDTTAAKTADHYREMYEMWSRRYDEVAQAVRAALVVPREISKSAARREAWQRLSDRIHNALRHGAT